MVGTVSTGSPWANTDKRVVFPLYQGEERSCEWVTKRDLIALASFFQHIPVLKPDDDNVQFLRPEDLQESSQNGTHSE